MKRRSFLAALVGIPAAMVGLELVAQAAAEPSHTLTALGGGAGGDAKSVSIVVGGGGAGGHQGFTTDLIYDESGYVIGRAY